MKLKKMAIVSLSTLVFGSFFPSFLAEEFHYQNGYVVIAQEDVVALLTKIKTNLIAQEPIVETQIAKVDNQDLLNFYEAASDATPWQDIYRSISAHYTGLGLITDAGQIAKYKSILAEINTVTGKTTDELKNADPKAVIAGYDAAKAAHPEDATQMMQTLLAGLDLNYGKLSESERSAMHATEAALAEKLKAAETTTGAETTVAPETATETTVAEEVSAAEATEAAEPTLAEDVETTVEESMVAAETTEAEVSEELTIVNDSTAAETLATEAETTVAETVVTEAETTTAEATMAETTAEQTTAQSEEEKFRQILVEGTDITPDQLAKISAEELTKMTAITGLPLTATDDNYLMVFRRELVTHYPERFTTQQINDVANSLRSYVVAHTPMTQEIVSQIPDEDFLQWSRESSADGNSITYPYLQAYKNYPKLFTNLLESTKNNLTTHTKLTAEQLNVIDPVLMMLLNWEATAYSTPYADVEKALLENYQQNKTETTTTQAETTTAQATTTVAETTTTASNKTETTTVALQVNKTKQVEKKSLPKTGEKSSIWLIVIALAVAGLGFVLLKNKNKQ